MVNAKLFLTMNPEDWSWKASTELSPEEKVDVEGLSEEGGVNNGLLLLLFPLLVYRGEKILWDYIKVGLE